jgi:hypothetical protein
MSQIGRWLLLLGALGFAALGQFYFARRPEYFWDAVIFYAIAALLMLLLVRERAAVPAPAEPRPMRADLEVWVRRALVSASLILGVAVVVMLARPREQYWPVFWLWVTAMVVCVVAYVPRPTRSGQRLARTWLRVDGWEVVLVLLLLVGAFMARAWRIDAIPWTLSGDEGNFGRWAREVLDGRVVNMFVTGHLSMPNMYIFWQAAWLKLVGDNMVGLRLPWALVGTLSILGAYLLVRRLFSRGLALLVALLLAGYHYHLHYSRLGLNNIADPFFVVWALYFLVVGWQGNKRWAWAFSGVLAGLAFFFYTGGRQVPVILVGVVTWAALTERDFLTRSRAGLVALVIGFVVAVGPMALFAVQHPDDFNARVNQIGVIQSGWLDREATLLGQSKLYVLAEQFRKVFFAFNFYKDRTDFYKPSIPLMDFASAVLFLLGLVLCVARLVQRPHDDTQASEESAYEKPVWRYSVFVIWFFVAIITGGVLTESAPSSQRILSSAVPAIFFVATALWELTLVLAGLLNLPAVGHRVLVGMLAIVLTAVGLRFYFGEYQRSWVYGSFNGEVATRIGYYLRDLGSDWQEYFFGAPRMYADFGSTSFIAKGVGLHDVGSPLTGPPSFVDSSRRAVFVFLPERASELAVVQRAYPNGVLEEVHRIGEPDGPLLFLAYRVESQ